MEKVNTTEHLIHGIEMNSDKLSLESQLPQNVRTKSCLYSGQDNNK